MQLPGPSGLELIRFANRMRGPEILDSMVALWKTYGDRALVKLPLGPAIYFLNDPSQVMEVLVRHGKKLIKGSTLDTFKVLMGNGIATSEQREWVEHRRTAQPHFHRERLASYAATIVQTVTEHSTRWLNAGPGFRDFNLLFPQLSLDVVARTLLDVNLGGRVDEINRRWYDAMDFVVARTHAFVRLPLELPLLTHRRFIQSARFIRNTVKDVIALKQQEYADGGPDTFLRSLLTRHASGDLSLEKIESQLTNILFAGHETTADGLSSATYLMLRHPEVRQKVMAELDAVLGGEPASYRTLTKQTYLRQVVYEALRLYPPVSIIARQPQEDVPLSSFVLPRGAIVLISPFIIHRHPSLWDEPDIFSPERFAVPARMEPPFFLAFGAGGRTCIGDQFAVNEIMIVLSCMFQTLHIELDTSRSVRPLFNGTLRPNPLMLRLSARN